MSEKYLRNNALYRGYLYCWYVTKLLYSHGIHRIQQLGDVVSSKSRDTKGYSLRSHLQRLQHDIRFKTESTLSFGQLVKQMTYIRTETALT